ncbi:hypothetical protein PGT21_005590 [Puccinia graminis f. sp. tritici]|uniref:Uncharacterized protein n=1 Tax=Puccinia graminis f. sp. tritici TaxID=56615 RepID=A0A5B0N9K7_PUCGR|nr:hypothetical protein PGT21_005590 [Puccinia graminis f. sp. tritici]KAA1129937.1 hypothetical protein PGTUg99_007722 [Puccinia graminis f. sp. tritici]
MGPMETTTQALNLEQTSVQGLKREGHHPSTALQPVSSHELGSVCLSSGMKFSSTNHQLTSLPASNQPKPTQPGHPKPLRDTQAPHEPPQPINPWLTHTHQGKSNPCMTQAWVLQGSSRPLVKIQTLDDGLQASNLEQMSVQGSNPG